MCNKELNGINLTAETTPNGLIECLSVSVHFTGR